MLHNKLSIDLKYLKPLRNFLIGAKNVIAIFEGLSQPSTSLHYARPIIPRHYLPNFTARTHCLAFWTWTLTVRGVTSLLFWFVLGPRGAVAMMAKENRTAVVFGGHVNFKIVVALIP